MLDTGIYHQDLLKQAIRNSLTGRVRKVLTTLKPNASKRDILGKLEKNFGDVKTEEIVIEEFYNTSQERNEDVANWGTRLENLLQKAVDKGEIDSSRSERMLRNRFWRHLKDTELRNSTRKFYESEMSYDMLKRRVRREEQEMSTRQKETDGSGRMLKYLLERLKKMEYKIDQMNNSKEDQNQHRDRESSRGRPRMRTGGMRGRRGGYINSYNERPRYRQYYNQNQNLN